MQGKAFTAGVAPGGLTTEIEIKILICWLLMELSEPAPKTVILSSLVKEGLVNYFECAEAIGDLLDKGNIEQSEGGFSLTKAGRDIAGTLYTDVPQTVRERALARVREGAAFYKSRRQHRTEIRREGGGYSVLCRVADERGELFSLSLYAPTREYAENIERNFVMRGEETVSYIIESLTAETGE